MGADCTPDIPTLQQQPEDGSRYICIDLGQATDT